MTRRRSAIPSIWFYNVGGPLDWTLPITPRRSSTTAHSTWRSVTFWAAAAPSMRWSGRAGMAPDYDALGRGRRQGWASRTSCRCSRPRRTGRAGATNGAASAARSIFAARGNPHPTAPAFFEAAGRWASPPGRHERSDAPGAGYINMNIAATVRGSAPPARFCSRISVARTHAPAEHQRYKVLFDGDRATGVELATATAFARFRRRAKSFLRRGRSIPPCSMLSGIGDAE